MSLVDTETGEIVALDPGAAERRAMKISLRLDTIADNYDAVMPMIREAISLRDDVALGYRSPGDYVRDRFGNALSRLGVEVRREVVRELTEAGLSTRAIAPVVGVSKSQVATDREQVSSTGHLPERPEPEPPPVTGIDGKSYPKAAPNTRTKRSPLADEARTAGWELRRAVERIERIVNDDRFTANKEQVAAHLYDHLSYSIEVGQDLITQLKG